MKITAITVWALEMPLVEPYWLSGGRLRFDALDSTFVRVDTDAGLSGWGEACPWGHTYLPAYGAGVRSALTLLAPALLGLDPRDLDVVNARMDVTLPGHPYAKAPLDIACWDITGQAAGMSLTQLLGGAADGVIPVNSSIATGTPDEMLARIEKARSKGYRVHSAKIGGSDVATDIARIDALSGTLPPGEKITFDVNRAWTPGIAVQVLNSVRARDWIEQPCETLDACCHVARRVDNPLMLDECMTTFADHLAAWRAEACEGVKVKPNRLGGLTRARQVRDFGVSVGWQMHIEDVGGSALADTAALHLAASTRKENRLASWLCHDHLAVDPVAGAGVRNEGGIVVMPDGPGLGVAPDLDQLGVPDAHYGAPT
ncbi:MAG: mandelate racemase/muconate lactonizing enzyme family protein [Pseudomonadota bacterium]